MRLFKQLLTSRQEDHAQDVKTLIVTFIASFGLAIHVLLLFAFAYIGATTMVYVNLISVLAWGAALVIGRRGNYPRAIGIACLEVLFHSVMAASEVGLAMGFQHYLWAMGVLALLNTSVSLWKALVFSAVFVVTFALVYVLYADVSNPYALGGAIPVIHTVNVIIAGVPLLISGIVFRAMYDNHVYYLSELASRDAMTGIFNRRSATEMAERLHVQLDREKRELSLILVDIDRFKRINDGFGHSQGDEVIKQVVQLICSMIRKSDFVSRWGGEEFLVILPGAGIESASRIAESIRQGVEEQVRLPNEKQSPVTVSLGVANWNPEQSFKQVFQLVDEALYRSKTNGRNRVTRHQTSPSADLRQAVS